MPKIATDVKFIGAWMKGAKTPFTDSAAPCVEWIKAVLGHDGFNEVVINRANKSGESVVLGLPAGHGVVDWQVLKINGGEYRVTKVDGQDVTVSVDLTTDVSAWAGALARVAGCGWTVISSTTDTVVLQGRGYPQGMHYHVMWGRSGSYRGLSVGYSNFPRAGEMVGLDGGGVQVTEQSMLMSAQAADRGWYLLSDGATLYFWGAGGSYWYNTWAPSRGVRPDGGVYGWFGLAERLSPSQSDVWVGCSGRSYGANLSDMVAPDKGGSYSGNLWYARGPGPGAATAELAGHTGSAAVAMDNPYGSFCVLRRSLLCEDGSTQASDPRAGNPVAWLRGGFRASVLPSWQVVDATDSFGRVRRYLAMPVGTLGGTYGGNEGYSDGVFDITGPW